MIHDVLNGASTLWPQIGLVLFLLFFAVVLFWTLRGSRDRFARESRLPLDSEQSLVNASSEVERTGHEQE